MSVFFSVGSLILGLIAWILPIVAMNGRLEKRKGTAFCPLSFSSCAAALILQMLEIEHRVRIEDFSAIMDTIGAVIKVSIFLVVVTAFLNLLALAVRSSERDA